MVTIEDVLELWDEYIQIQEDKGRYNIASILRISTPTLKENHIHYKVSNNTSALEIDLEKQEIKYRGFKFGNGDFFNSADVYIEFSGGGSMQYRPTDGNKSWQGEIKGTKASGGKAGGGATNYYTELYFGKSIDAKTHVIHVRSFNLSQLDYCFKEDLNIEPFPVFDGYAASSSSLTRDEKDLGVIFIDIGSDKTNIMFYKNNYLIHSKVIPLGSKLVTKDMAAYLQTSLKEAERVKLTNVSAFSDFAEELSKQT